MNTKDKQAVEDLKRGIIERVKKNPELRKAAIQAAREFERAHGQSEEKAERSSGHQDGKKKMR